jgi:oligopeptide ABC superfamily ATP binding cassette transporter, permease protein
MNTLLEHFPKAARWALIMLIVIVITILFQLVALINARGTQVVSEFVTLVVLVIQAILFYSYWQACKTAIASEDARDVELACSKQLNLIRFYGIMMLILLIIGALLLLFGGMGALSGR